MNMISNTNNSQEHISKSISSQSPLSIVSSWVGHTRALRVFDSEHDELNSEALWNKIKGRRNLMFVVVTTEGNVFGSYHSIIPHSQGSWVSSDDDQFIFTLRNSSGTPPTIFRPKQMTHRLLHISKSTTKKKLVWISDAFKIQNDDKSYISSSFSRFYNDEKDLGPSIFTNLVYPNTFSFSSFFVLHWF
ncbi:hypothetical protein EIN_497940 [Entamoeba invadens IP1]|uniref:TLDc domain-containing protein n=1 Tax=Entamoeba invadens IP1 TaxID=370355 RepID=A0A0A1UDU3_ENTIV|nr:hypothetical protein EIN_497940 [Entamoeba invadens IP1]ELP94614.1 hypothetical protein EIN_497940 [Entamoeba invadens IP1]|eukprot:XP_004261385.1 hypothetical protein EIN_497940 [Entamoeba invadens IP1]